jgi:hypothetical protein
MLGRPPEVLTEKPSEVETANHPDNQAAKALGIETVKPSAVKTSSLPTVETPLREKTSFAILPDVKRHLTLLKLDLRSAGHRITEAEIVEALISSATTESVLGALCKRPIS